MTDLMMEPKDSPSAPITEAFRQVALRVVAMTQRYYLLSYCSPARAGTHRVTVEAVTPDTSSGTTRPSSSSTPARISAAAAFSEPRTVAT